MRKQTESAELCKRFRQQFAGTKANEDEPGEATDRSSPLTLQQTYQIRFDRADVKAMERALGIGYPDFTRRGIFGSQVATEVFLWRGLREEDEKGELVHVFPMNDAGKEQAGELLWSFMQESENPDDMGRLYHEIMEGFFTAKIAYRAVAPKDGAGKKGKSEGKPPKN